MNHSLTTTTTTTNQQQQTHQDGQQQQQQQQQLPLKANQHRMNCNNQLRTNQLQIQHHPTTTVDRIQLPNNNHSSNSLKESIKLNETRHTNNNKKKKIDLESFPQETLLKNLANLFDRITSRNDHLNDHTRRRPATPSSELGRKSQDLLRRRRRRRPGAEEAERASTHQEDSFMTENLNYYDNHPRRDNDEDCEDDDDDDDDDDDETEEEEDEDEGRRLNTRPTQSPTVIHFQKLNQQNTRSPYSSPLAEPSCSPNIHHSSTNKEQQLSTASLELLSKPNSILTFHAKIVPQISIEAYLLRILKYCPTSNGVFLSTLIYLDRLCTFNHCHPSSTASSSSSSQTTTTTTPLSSLSSSSSITSTTTSSTTTPTSSSSLSSSATNFNEIAKKKKKKNKWNLSPNHLTQFNFHFVIDSWNVHRFLIASITAASKLLSDVFYTNSRYAKVGGLPLEELEELEIKFLLMSDFRLMISASEFEDYTERLLGSSSSITTPTRCKLPSTSTSPPATTTTRRTIIVTEETDEESEEGMDGEGSDSDSDTDTEQDRLRSGHLNAILTPHSGLIHHESSSASSVSSCNSSERSSCSTITPHSPPPPQTPTHPPKSPPVTLPTTPRSAFASSSSSSASPSIS
ncbi:hypothetical protein PGTUg99_035278 [Puccinia graminis f. sp. tritici]|uniref:Cyclin-domain-containing protein n=1 Tax=Puccinia graminis f. sp. tritici TaxID=56615 RepID=A0A5B0SH30_PUCGR|nr:hypothetical protein PGTUg99_035278 [Puccinia graminis f. sp. tritici]